MHDLNFSPSPISSRDGVTSRRYAGERAPFGFGFGRRVVRAAKQEADRYFATVIVAWREAVPPSTELVPAGGVEPTTCGLCFRCSTVELHWRIGCRHRMR